MTTSVQPTSDTDLAVAIACGFEAKILDETDQRPCHFYGCVINTPHQVWHSFKPTTDIKDAFQAADKIELFTKHICQLGKLDPLHWDISKYEFTQGRNGFYHLAAGKTAALAICAAILSLKDIEPVSAFKHPATVELCRDMEQIRRLDARLTAILEERNDLANRYSEQPKRLVEQKFVNRSQELESAIAVLRGER